MRPQSAAVSLSTSSPSAERDFTLYWTNQNFVNRSSISTASGGFDLTYTVKSPAPASSCVVAKDSRTQQSTAMTLTSTGTTNVWTLSIFLPASSPEGSFSLTGRINDCATGTQIDVGGSAPYTIDNSAPTLNTPIPADNANALVQPTTSISAFVGDARSGVSSSSVSMLLDGNPVSASKTPIGTSVLVSYQASGMAPGWHTVSVSATDNAGNAAAPFSWGFLVSAVTLPPSAPVDTSPDSTATVPLTYTTGQALPVVESAIALSPTSLTLDGSARPGFGVVCGTVNLSNLRGRFTRVDGSTVDVAPSNLAHSTHSVCRNVAVLDGTGITTVELYGGTASIGSLSFAIPLGATPNSTVQLVFAPSAPTINWLAPCHRVNAGPGSVTSQTATVCDLVPNYIDRAQALRIEKGVEGRQQTWFSQGYTRLMSEPLASVWKAAPGGGLILNRPAFDASRTIASSTGSSFITAASPYSTTGGGVVVYQQHDRYANLGAGTPAPAADEAYFDWPSELATATGRAQYASLSWTAGTASAIDFTVVDETGEDVTALIDDSGQAAAWNAYEDLGRGAVYGFKQRFTAGGAQKVVTSGWLSVNASGDVCGRCTINRQLVDAAIDATFDANPDNVGFAVTNPGSPAPMMSSASIICGAILPASSSSSESANNLTACGGGGCGQDCANPPGVTLSHYILESQVLSGVSIDGPDTTNPMYRLGASDAGRLNGNSCRDYMIVLAFGRPIRSDEQPHYYGYSMLLVNTDKRANFADIKAAVFQFAAGWYAASGCNKVKVVIGTANNWICHNGIPACDTGEFGRLFGDLVSDTVTKVNAKGYQSEVWIWGGNDVEPNWDPSKAKCKTSDIYDPRYVQTDYCDRLPDGYVGCTRSKLILDQFSTRNPVKAQFWNFGSAEAGWCSDSDIHYMSSGHKDSRVMAQVYGPGQSQRWVNLKKWAKTNNRVLTINGVMSDCPYGGHYPPRQAWERLYYDMHAAGVGQTGSSLMYLTNIGKGEPDPVACGAY